MDQIECSIPFPSQRQGRFNSVSFAEAGWDGMLFESVKGLRKTKARWAASTVKVTAESVTAGLTNHQTIWGGGGWVNTI